MGPGNYSLIVGIMSPSVIRADKWEIGTDYFGGVQSRTHTSVEMSHVKWYLALGTLFFLVTYLFII